MKAIIVLIGMIFLHCFADYCFQGILANMKQREWWQNRYKDPKQFECSRYKKDYVIALIAHSIEWTFIVMLPMLYVTQNRDYIPYCSVSYITLFILNATLHYSIDNLKANKHKLNLIQDQCLHFLCIFGSWILWTCIGWS